MSLLEGMNRLMPSIPSMRGTQPSFGGQMSVSFGAINEGQAFIFPKVLLQRLVTLFCKS